MKLSEYIQSITGEEGKKNSNGYVFHSPWREDKNASFQVSDELGKWHDWSTGESGDLIDAIRIHNNCDYKTAISLLGYVPQKVDRDDAYKEKKREQNYTTQPIYHYPLIDYAKSRCVAPDVLRRYCVELNEGNYYYIALPNTANGYAIRNAKFKGQRGASSFSFFIGNNTSELLVFEGMFDMLSFVSISNTDKSILVLNSTANTNKAIAQLSQFDVVHCYLDNDASGKESTDKIKSSHHNVIDHSENYKQFNDVNDFIIHHQIP